jgi:hypothetical protein
MWVLFWRLQVLGYFLDFKLYIFMWGNIANIIPVLQNELRKISYEDGHIEQLQDERRQLLSAIRNLKDKIDAFDAR